MNFTQTQNYEILENIIKHGSGIEEILRMSLEILMKAERHEHNFSNGDLSNGYRFRKTYGQGKLLELKVPRTRNGNFYPMILGLLRDQEEEARQIAFKLYGAGLTTEQVGDLFGEIYGKSYSSSQVSRMFDYAREDVAAWLTRRLDSYYPILYIDATFIATRRVDSVSKEAYFTILAVKEDTSREVLAVVNNPTEGSSFWNDIFTDLKERGVKEVGLVVSDGLTGIETVVQNHFKMADVQLCTVHLQREFQKKVKVKHKAEVAEDLRQVFAYDDKYDSMKKGMEKFHLFCEKWSKHYPSFGDKITNERYRYYFTYLNYDYRIRSMIYTTNWIERLNRDYKRTTRMRGALPCIEAIILLLGYVAMTRNAYHFKVTLFLNEKQKFRWDY